MFNRKLASIAGSRILHFHTNTYPIGSQAALIRAKNSPQLTTANSKQKDRIFENKGDIVRALPANLTMNPSSFICLIINPTLYQLKDGLAVSDGYTHASAMVCEIRQNSLEITAGTAIDFAFEPAQGRMAETPLKKQKEDAKIALDNFTAVGKFNTEERTSRASFYDISSKANVQERYFFFHHIPENAVEIIKSKIASLKTAGAPDYNRRNNNCAHMMLQIFTPTAYNGQNTILNENQAIADLTPQKAAAMLIELYCKNYLDEARKAISESELGLTAYQRGKAYIEKENAANILISTPSRRQK